MHGHLNVKMDQSVTRTVHCAVLPKWIESSNNTKSCSEWLVAFFARTGGKSAQRQ